MSDILIDGKVKVTFIPSTTGVADTSAPDTTELAAGADVEAYITPDGLAVELSDDSVDTSALNSTFTTMKVGRSNVTLGLTFKDQGKGAAPWTTFADRASGHLVVRRNVDASTAYADGDDVEVYTVKAGDHMIVPAAENEVSKFNIDLFSQADPVLDAVVATA